MSYTAAPQATQNITIGQAAQTITFGAQGGQTYSGGGSFALNPVATATSGLTVSYSSTTPAVCTIANPVVATVSMVAAGTCTIAANQAGNVSYAAAPQATQSIVINKANQAALNALAGATTLLLGTTTNLNFSGGSGTGTVTFGSNNANCTIVGTVLTAAAVGTCTVTATKAADTNYNLTTGTILITVNLLQAQTISFTNPGPQVAGRSANLNASATSGLTVTFSSQTPAVCSFSGEVANLLTAGTCTLAADQAGNGTYAAAPTVVQSFDVAPPAPNPPLNHVCVAGVAKATCSFLPPVANGGTAVTSYTVTCIIGIGSNPITISGAASPLTLTGLVNGKQYGCTATATNAQGTSNISNIAYVIPKSLTSRYNGIDINGDGRAVVVARATGGNLFIGSLNAQNQFVFTPTPDPGPVWRTLGAGDFSGSGHSDLLIQNIASGDVHIWAQFQGPLDSDFFVRHVKPGWVVDAITDIDGDGDADIVWRYIGSPLNPPTNPDDVGVVFVWFMKGNTIDQIKFRGGAPLSWNLIGAADLFGTGGGTLVWVSPSGAIRSLTALPGRNFANVLVGTVPTGYTLTNLGDFNGDSMADFLFNDGNGNLQLWLMNGTNVQSVVQLPAIDPTWQIYATGDFNGDGTRDIVFRKPDNTLVLWLMNAATPQTPTVVNNAGKAPTGAVVIEL